MSDLKTHDLILVFRHASPRKRKRPIFRGIKSRAHPSVVSRQPAVGRDAKYPIRVIPFLLRCGHGSDTSHPGQPLADDSQRSDVRGILFLGIWGASVCVGKRAGRRVSNRALQGQTCVAVAGVKQIKVVKELGYCSLFRWSCGAETPNFKLQASEKLQTSSLKGV